MLVQFEKKRSQGADVFDIVRNWFAFYSVSWYVHMEYLYFGEMNIKFGFVYISHKDVSWRFRYRWLVDVLNNE